jgi:hypothetical protein
MRSCFDALPIPGAKFKLNGKIYQLDASLLDLSQPLFPWAKYQKTKGAAKLHVGLDADGYLPAFVDLTAGREHEINLARTLALPKGPSVAFDRGYTGYICIRGLFEDGVSILEEFFWCQPAARLSERHSRVASPDSLIYTSRVCLPNRKHLI